MGAGKSTILRLIDYCLGSELNETPALQSEFMAAELKLTIEKFAVVLERRKTENTILAAFTDGGVTNSYKLPTKGNETLYKLFDKDIANISDLIFVLANKTPPKVTRSKLNEDSEIVRLSFRDIMWFCYLDQENIDSSFFYLGKEDNTFRQLKSKDVLMYILDYNQQVVSQLRNDLAYAMQEQQSLKKSSMILKEYFKENNIEDQKEIVKEKEYYEEKIYQLDISISELNQQIVKEKEHPLDSLKVSARQLSENIDRYRKGIENYDYRINEQEKLKNEFITSQIKSDRFHKANLFFRDIEFKKCPQCGLKVTSKPLDNEQCYLCKQPQDRMIQHSYDIDQDLKLRIKELDESIDFLKGERSNLESHLDMLLEEKKRLDNRIIVEESAYDSKFLSYVKNLQKDKISLLGKIDALNRLIPLVNKVEEMDDQALTYETKIRKLRLDLQKASEQIEKDNQNLNDLKHYFLDVLIKVGFPGVTENHKVIINPRDFIPKIENPDTGMIISFYNAGSGGKKTIFKTCFAIALHMLAIKIGSSLPTFLMLDTPMKNISEREDITIFERFYSLIYELSENELKKIQFIIVDKEFYEPQNTELEILNRHMTPDVDDHPPLIPYYRGY